MKIIPITQPFIIPLDIEHRFGVDEDKIVAYYTYWTPCGDECIVGRIYHDGIITESDSDWTAFLKLEQLNPIMRQFNLGSSDRPAEYVLLIDKQNNKFYFIRRDTKRIELYHLLGINIKRGGRKYA